ncbi:MAG TPA: orotate phosphoribosyltransferase [Humidesulfovibrio sp.]|uniref:orotate phosphoribosyltransferase n=1 Tax=Humidesulfovibrio sp. TaxID=2910988 RepID=UPI002CAF3995|nr:orotate phosphoribosyltransferase [Humidesulfovibrio sp.]HWR05179.1 orotate phosphoribosyltransferase [Humidesulfovibrio sp.]
MNDSKAKLARLLMALSYSEGDFVLTSGRKSDYYFDCRQTALNPEGCYLIGKLFLEMLEGSGARAVAGMTMGADPLVSSVAVLSHIEGRPIPAIVVRKQSKGHGTNQFLEGLKNVQQGDTIALLEDVVSTGGSLLAVAERVRAAGFTVGSVLCVLDREEGGREALAGAGLELKSIFTRKELLAAAKG